MGSRTLIIFFAMALAMASKSIPHSLLARGPNKPFMNIHHVQQGTTFSSRACINIGLFGDCLDEVGEAVGDVTGRRNLAQKGGRYISYDAMKKDNIPCNHKGRSYYGCGQSGKANPYQRACTAITNCARYTN